MSRSGQNSLDRSIGGWDGTAPAQPLVAVVVALGVGMVAALVAAFGWLLWRGPAWVYRAAWPRLTPAEQVTATGQFRIALVQVAGAVGAVVALAYTARTYRLAHSGQLTERFSNALERLGSDEPYVRLGGVHALAHLLRDSADHHRIGRELLPPWPPPSTS